MVLIVNRYGTTVDRTTAVVTTPEELQQRIGERKMEIKKGARDF